jgi:hypothetical protein
VKITWWSDGIDNGRGRQIDTVFPYHAVSPSRRRLRQQLLSAVPTEFKQAPLLANVQASPCRYCNLKQQCLERKNPRVRVFLASGSSSSKPSAAGAKHFAV